MVPKCTRCGSKNDATPNLTNFSHKYYCGSCDLPFNPDQWTCPLCETDEDVTQNPLDGTRDYYCYECNMQFDRLGPSFDPDTIEYGTLEHGFDSPAKQLTLAAKQTTETEPLIYKFTLKNTGQEPIEIQGDEALAFQFRVTDDDWWTVHGNPENFTPNEQFRLAPTEVLEWDLELSWKDLELPRVRICDRFESGEYRLVYWGIPASESALAANIHAEFKFY